ncbi:MAG TPA: transcription termination/antitermination protein NusG [Gemmatimonadales bacterium]
MPRGQSPRLSAERAGGAMRRPAVAFEGPEIAMAKKWYVVHTYSGFENKVKKSLEEYVRQHGDDKVEYDDKEDGKAVRRSAPLTECFGEILIPMEQVVEMVRGEKKTSKRKFFPGYILVQMQMSDATWHMVKATPKVTGFVGSAKNPRDVPAISDAEVARLTSQISEGTLKPKPKVQFEEGDQVRVIDGPFSNFNGTVEEVKPDKGKLRVLVSIFGRATPVELDFMQVEKT